MLKLILRQANWGIVGTLFAFAIGLFVKIYLIDIVGLQQWGKYAAAQTFSSISETFLSIGIPFVIIKFFPSFIDNNQEKASRIANVFIKYAFIVGGLFLLLIYYTLRLVKKLNKSVYPFVSSDDQKIINYCNSQNITTVYKRPKK